jgi:hypothetical protein
MISMKGFWRKESQFISSYIGCYLRDDWHAHIIRLLKLPEYILHTSVVMRELFVLNNCFNIQWRGNTLLVKLRLMPKACYLVPGG